MLDQVILRLFWIIKFYLKVTNYLKFTLLNDNYNFFLHFQEL
jgi:hypothetical protein